MVARRYKAWSVVVIILALFLVSCASQTPQTSSTSGGDCEAQCQSKHNSCLSDCNETWSAPSRMQPNNISNCQDDCRLDLLSCKLRCKDKG